MNWKAFLALLKDYPIAATTAAIGGLWAVAVQFIEAYHIMEFSKTMPLGAFTGIGLFIFFVSVMVMLMKFHATHTVVGASSLGISQKGQKLDLSSETPPPDTAPTLIASDLPNRIFHFNRSVNFDHLNEGFITLALYFFNGNEERVIAEGVRGSINCDGSFPTIQLPIPGLASTSGGQPFEELRVILEQRIPNESAPIILDDLNSGAPISFNLTGLTLQLRCIRSGESFPAKMWQGIACTKKDAIVCHEMTYFHARGGARTSGKD